MSNDDSGGGGGGRRVWNKMVVGVSVCLCGVVAAWPECVCVKSTVSVCVCVCPIIVGAKSRLPRLGRVRLVPSSSSELQCISGVLVGAWRARNLRPVTRHESRSRSSGRAAGRAPSSVLLSGSELRFCSTNFGTHARQAPIDASVCMCVCEKRIASSSRRAAGRDVRESASLRRRRTH